MKRILSALLIILLLGGCGPVNEELDLPEKGFSRQDLIYFIMVDRFHDGDKSNNGTSDYDPTSMTAFHGGDLQGIIDKLDYIKGLGTTAIWLTPIMENGPYGYHGYWIYDFYQVDPHFGDLDTMKTLVEEAHKRDMKVILDFVVNHAGYNTPWLEDPEKADWFHPMKNISNWNDQQEVEDGWLSGLPDFDQDEPEVRAYFIENALWWIEETKVDGFRLDTVRHVPKDYWQEFSQAIKEEYPDFFLMGEVWSENSRYLELYHELGIDSMINYSLYGGIERSFSAIGDASSLVNALKREQFFSSPQLNGIFLDNHDNPRLINSGASLGEEILTQGLTFIMTYPAIPIIYYGTEIGLEGGGDPENRKDMDFTAPASSPIYTFYNKLQDLRQSHVALQQGDFSLLFDDKKTLVYQLAHEDNQVVVALNFDKAARDLSIPLPGLSGSFIDFSTEKVLTLNEELTLPIQGKGFIILYTEKR